MITPACYCCGSSQNEFYVSENGFTLVKCSACGLLYVWPLPSNAERDEAVRLGVHRGEQDIRVTGSFSKRRVEPYLKILGDLYGEELQGRRLSWLDIGCGHGEFMVALRKFNPRTQIRGLEPNVYKQKAAQKRNLDVSFFDIGSHRQRYDMLSLLNVYSHLPDPPSFLVRCRELLAPEG